MRIIVPLVACFAWPLATAEASDRWLRPVPGDVVEAFTYDGRPYAAGRHRGVDLAARPGAAVRAPCTGPVTFAGPVPRRGRAVTLRCGDALTATVLDLAHASTRNGARVRRGAIVGRALGRSVHLGARRTGRRHAYVDPLRLLAVHDPLPPGAPVPAGPRGRAPLPGRLPAPSRRPLPSARATPAPAHGAPPLAAWVGLALLAAGAPAGALARRRGRATGRAAARARAAQAAR